MGAQGVPQPLVAALADQVQVDLAEGGQPAVRVVHDVDVVAVAHVEAVVAGRFGDDPGPQPGVVHTDQRVRPLRVAVDQDRHLVGMRAQCPDDGALRMRVGAQHLVRVVVGPAEDAVDHALVGRAGVDRLGLMFALHRRNLIALVTSALHVAPVDGSATSGRSAACSPGDRGAERGEIVDALTEDLHHPGVVVRA